MRHPRATVKAVLFDLDDTLVDHTHSARAGLAAVQRRYRGLHHRPLRALEAIYSDLVEEFHSRVLQGLLTLDEARVARLREFLTRAGERVSEEAIRDAAIAYRDAYHAASRPVPGAVPLLQHLRSFVRIGVVTNHVTAEQQDKLAVCGLAPLIDVLITSEEIGVAKPDPAIFEAALRRLGCDREAAVMVGDSWQADILGAHAAGIRAVWLNRFGLPCPDPAVATPIVALEPEVEVAAMLLDGKISAGE
ncbi:MAG: HAD family hydrolase [Ardenticatenaceae bacterium]|nr:HAD family hydrolase [Ardenticatenaceae bacterium]